MTTEEEQKEEAAPATAAAAAEADDGGGAAPDYQEAEETGTSDADEEDNNNEEEEEERSMGSFGDLDDGEESAPVLEVSSANLESPSGPGTAEGDDAGSSSHNSGLTEESSFSEYEEDVFPEEQDEEGKGGRNTAVNYDSSLSGASSMPSTRSLGGQSQHSVNVSATVWARTWEERAKGFQKAHPAEYRVIEKNMKQKDILKIENERSQRIYENKVFQNVDRIFKILGGAVCGLCCCIILIIIVLAAVLKHNDDAPPAPTIPPYGSITTVPPKLRAPSVAPSLFAVGEPPSAAPVVVAAVSNNSTAPAVDVAGNGTAGDAFLR